MKRCIPIIIVLSLFIACNNNKDPQTDIPDSASGHSSEDLRVIAPDNDTAVVVPPGPANKEPAPRRPANGNDKNKILANIDQYLISKPSVSAATLTVENTLKDATIIKAYAEVTIVDAAGKNLRTDFLILEHIEPGGSKSVRIPDVSNGASIISHIIRLNSDELTNGETIMVGSRYVPK